LTTDRSRARLLDGLLETDEPRPVLVERSRGGSPFFLTCDHAGLLIPRRLGDLGVDERARRTHIGWDIGALAVAQRLSARLDATLVVQRYSRLVIDCNRIAGTASSIPIKSERTEIPGNVDISTEDRRAREREILEPYHAEIARLLDERVAAGRKTLLLAVHSFTPVYDGVPRPWHVALATDDYRPLGEAMIAALREDRDLVVGDNEPYSIDDVDHTIPVHGARRGLPRALLEIRNDRIETEAGQREWADRLARVMQTTGPAL
jgi:predicted N-formylglutamate amidohydrolase